ncbi:MAG: FAD-dependent oxidoreductase [Chloroflexota bacterium]
MAEQSADIIICGAGIAGVAAAYFLTVRQGVKDVILVDEHPPLSLTSDKSTECYRNWWPDPAMVALMNRSVDLMEELAHQNNNLFHLNRRGYLYLSSHTQHRSSIVQAAQHTSAQGGGPLRVHQGHTDDPAYQPASTEGFENQPSGADLFLSSEEIQRHFPYVSPQATTALHVRRAGWLSAQQLGQYMLSEARAGGAQLIQARVTDIRVKHNRVQSVRMEGEGAPTQVTTGRFVNAAGPFLKPVGRLMGVELPVFCELHTKMAMNDHLGVVPRSAPLLVWDEPQTIPWTQEEQAILLEAEDTHHLIGKLPAGAHVRPEGGTDSPMAIMLWAYHAPVMEPRFPPLLDPFYPEVVLRGIRTMLPGLAAYEGKMPKPQIDAGYYTKTRENRPLIGPLPVQGCFLIGALSGFGIMASCAAGELLAAHLTLSPLPSYADDFSLERYSDPAYQAWADQQAESGQL